MSGTDPTAYGLCITFPILSIVSTVARLYTRRIRKVPLGWSDYIIVLATFLATCNAGVVLWGAISAGLGQHIPTTKEGLEQLGPRVTTLEIMTYITKPLTTLAIGFARWSILLFYSTLFPVKAFRIPVYIMHFLNIGWLLAFTLVFLMACIPVDHLWTQSQGARTGCLPLSPNLYYAVINVILDFLTLCLPWPMIWRLKMPTSRKLGVLGILMLGAIIVGVSIGKCYAFFTIVAVLQQNHDITYDEGPLFYWTIPECCLAVVCANLPLLRPIFKGVSPESVIRSFRSVFSLQSRGSGSNTRNISHEQNQQSSEALDKASQLSNSEPAGSIALEDRSHESNVHMSSIQVKTMISVDRETEEA